MHTAPRLAIFFYSVISSPMIEFGNHLAWLFPKQANSTNLELRNKNNKTKGNRQHLEWGEQLL